ncbi:hypothetical protein BGZ70_007100 [Mortierella alpina]|uniref:Uncharacterized protein n=1 Tax=Mortierella alpina TaxID=64518 RepID=A0A9P6M383_MORAP|nr:hypothetical protein BGZ70_007100 [Mortierella alpina]
MSAVLRECRSCFDSLGTHGFRPVAHQTCMGITAAPVGTTSTTALRAVRPIFDHQLLLACILVNRTWHDILLPILWFTFDDTYPPSTSPVAIANLSRHHPHFRILELSRPCPTILSFPLTQLPHNLIHLDLSGLDNNEWTKELVLQNLRLQSLHWQGGDFHRDDYGTLDGLALSKKLSRLQELHLECWRIDKGFMALLRRNPSLRTISLDFVTGEIDELNTHTATIGASVTLDTHGSDKDPDSYDDNDEEGEVLLPNMTSLTVCKDVGSGALEALVRFCPKLEELSWMGSHDGDLRSLTTNIQQSCPSISALTYSTVEVMEDEVAYAGLIGGLSGLVELQIRIPSLDRLFTDALLKHADTLEVLDLRIQRDRKTQGTQRADLRRILEGCHQITALSIDGSLSKASDLFMFDWACLRLHRLFLSGLHPLTRGHPLENDNAVVAAMHGWAALSRTGGGDSTPLTAGQYDDLGIESISRMDSISGMGIEFVLEQQHATEQFMARKVSTSFLQSLLSQVRNLTHMQSFVLNGVEYTRTSDHLGLYSG